MLQKYDWCHLTELYFKNISKSSFFRTLGTLKSVSRWNSLWPADVLWDNFCRIFHSLTRSNMLFCTVIWVQRTECMTLWLAWQPCRTFNCEGAWQNQQNHMCVHVPQRLRSAWESVQSYQFSLCTLWVAKDQHLLQADIEDWKDWADAQAGLRFHWAHMELCCAPVQ